MQRLIRVFSLCLSVFAATICSGQSPSVSHTVLVREIHFTGEPGGTEKALSEYTEFIVGHRMEEKELLQEAESSVTSFLRHRGFLKARLTPKVRPASTFGNSKDAVVLDIAMQIGNRYLVKGVSFAGLSQPVAEADLKQACNFQEGEVADWEEASSCVANLKALFHQKGQDVTVTPNMTFDDKFLTVVFASISENRGSSSPVGRNARKDLKEKHRTGFLGI